MTWRVDRRRRDHFKTRIETITDIAVADRERITAVENRVRVLEAQRNIKPANDLVAVPSAFGEQVVKLGVLEQRFCDLEKGFLEIAQNTPHLIERMDMIEDGLAEAASLLKCISMIMNEQDALRRRVNVMNDQISDIAAGMQEASRLIKRA